MKATYENIKLSFSIEEIEQLRKDLHGLINDYAICEREISQGQAHNFEEKIKETYPKINEFLSILNIKDEFPF